MTIFSLAGLLFSNISLTKYILPLGPSKHNDVKSCVCTFVTFVLNTPLHTSYLTKDLYLKPYYENYLEENAKADSIQSQLDFMDGVVKGEINMLGGGNVKKIQESFKKDDVSEIAKDFNTIFEKGKMETAYGKRDELAEKNYSMYF